MVLLLLILSYIGEIKFTSGVRPIGRGRDTEISVIYRAVALREDLRGYP